MAKPKTTNLTKADVSTTLVSPRDRSKALLDPSATAVATGTVEGAWSIDHVRGDWAPDEAFLLEEGEVKHIPSGVAIRVQSSDGWHHCEFPQSGMLHGPVVWAPAKAADEGNLISKVYHPFSEQAAQVAFGVGLFGGASALGGSVPQVLAIVGAICSAFLTSFGVFFAYSAISNRISPLTIASVNKRVSKTLRMPRSMLGAPPSHLKLVTQEQPMDDLDREIQAHLQSYRAQRAAVVEKKIACSPIIEHAAAMIDEIETRLKGGTSHLRDDDLRRSYITLLQRAEADVVKSINKREAKEAESVARDITALLRQMDRYSN
jgi:hypothetical protein